MGLSPATNRSGHEITSQKYNQRTQQWDVRTVKQNKSYSYIPLLMARIFHARIEDTQPITRNVSLNAGDPRLLATAIAAKLPPSSTDLLQRQSRLSIPSKTETSTMKEISKKPTEEEN